MVDADIPEKYKFRYRVFASADIVGSTAFKTAKASERQSWARVFRGFFDEFPKAVSRSFNSLILEGAVEACKPSECMKVWKLVGDEVLLYADIKQHEHVLFHAIAFKDALNEYSEKLGKKGLALKGAIWGAGFPVMNVAVEVTVSASGDKAIDFLGPSVDLGFRLAAMADDRRIPISADIAHFLRYAKANSSDVGRKATIFVDPPQVLKGIQAGRGYPILWLDRLDGKETNEDKLLGRSRNSDINDVLRDYLAEKFQAKSVGLTRPFIEGDKSADFSQIPQEFVDWRERLMADDPDEQYGKAAAQTPETTGQLVEPPPPA